MNNLIEYFPWNEKFSTNIPQIDEQHKRLVHLLNKLANGLVNQANETTLNGIFNELADYASSSFR